MTTRTTSTPVEHLLSPRVKVVTSVRQWIEQGELRAGQELPSERTLADRLDVARGTVRSAVRALEKEGLVGDCGGKRCVMPGVSQGANSLLSHSIAVFARQLEAGVTDRIESPGWELFIERGALDGVFAAGYHGVSLNPDRLKERQGLQRLLTERPAGVIFGRYAFGHPDGPDLVQSVSDAGIPLVVYGNSPEAQQYDHVYSDHAAGASALVEHLTGLGCRKILRIWLTSREQAYWMVDRNRGVEEPLRRAGLPVIEPLYLGGPLPHTQGKPEQFSVNIHTLAGYLMPYLADPANRPDALMLVSDGGVCQLAAAVRLFGLEPGRDIHIVGYDNYYRDLIDQKFCSCAPTATVDKCNIEIGKQMVELLLARIGDKLPAEPQTRIVKPQLIIPDQPQAGHSAAVPDRPDHTAFNSSLEDGT